jgi:hypothetical protein
VTEASAQRQIVKGFADLATWYSGLVADEVTRVAQTMADGTFGLDAAAASLTRSAALPLLGMAALANELVDAAALQTVGPERARPITSDEFVARADEPTLTDRAHLPGRDRLTVAAIELDPDRPLTNGFGDQLGSPVVVVTLPQDATSAADATEVTFHLVASAVPPDRIGVFRGSVTVTDAEGAQHGQPVWLVVS